MVEAKSTMSRNEECQRGGHAGPDPGRRVPAHPSAGLPLAPRSTTCCRESGVGKGNFYYYFKSKEDLGFAIIDRLVRGFVERSLEPAFADADADPVAPDPRLPRSACWTSSGSATASGGCPMGNLASELSDVHEGFRQRLAGIFRRWRARLPTRSSGARPSGRLRPDSDAAGLAQFLVAALEGAILLTKVTKDIAVMEQCVSISSIT